MLGFVIEREGLMRRPEIVIAEAENKKSLGIILAAKNVKAIFLVVDSKKLILCKSCIQFQDIQTKYLNALY